MTADKRYDKHLRLTVPLTAQTEQLSIPPRVDSLWVGCIHQSLEELANSVLTLSGSHWFPVLTHRWGEESVQWMWRWGFLTWPPACRCDWEQISQIPIRRHLPEMMDRSLVSHQSSPAGERVTPVRNLSSYTTPLQPANHMEALYSKPRPIRRPGGFFKTRFIRLCDIVCVLACVYINLICINISIYSISHMPTKEEHQFLSSSFIINLCLLKCYLHKLLIIIWRMIIL